MLSALIDKPIRSLRDPRMANTRFAAAWAVEIEAGETAQVLELHHLRDRVSGPNPQCSLHAWYGAPPERHRWEFGALLTCLPPQEQKEVLSVRRKSDRWGVAAARAVVRIQLAGLLDCHPLQVAVIRSHLGKPFLDPAVHGSRAERLHFNVSHTNGLVAVAIATRRIGVDIEAVRPLPDMEGIASSSFAPQMFQILETARTPSEKESYFYRFWTLGEALIKATGEGFSSKLQSFAFSKTDPPHLTRIDGDWRSAKRWVFEAIDGTGTTVVGSES